MVFHIKDLDIAGMQTSFSQDSSYLPVKQKDTAQTRFTLIADNTHFQNISFKYNDALNKLLFALQLGDLQMQLNEFGLGDNNIYVKKLAMSNTAITLSMGAESTAPAFVDTLIKIDTTSGWHITGGDIKIAGTSFKMDINSSPRQPSGIDYSHLYFKNTDLSMRNFLYTSDTIAGNVTHFAGTEQCGLAVQELRTVFNYNPQGAVLKNLYLKTPNTVLQDHVEVHYPSLEALQKRTQVLQLNLDLKNSIVGLQDVLIFVPQLKSQEIFRKHGNDHFNVTAAIKGYLNNLNIANLSASGLSNTQIVVNGRLGGLPEMKELNYDLHVSQFVSSRKDVSTFVPDSVLSDIRLPDRFGVTGLLSGTELDYNADMVMVSTDGRAYIKGTLETSHGKGKEAYNFFVKTDQLNVGRILKEDSLMSTVSANITVKGQSFDTKTMTAAVAAEISGANIKGYNYHDLKMQGNVAEQAGTLRLVAADSNLRVNLKAQADFSGKYTAVVADLVMDSIDFHALKLYSSDLRTSGIIHADIKELNMDYPKGEVVWRQPVVTTGGTRYYIDSMSIISRPSADTGQNIIADIDALQATVRGKTPLTKIAGIIQDHINRHYALPSYDSTANMHLMKASTAITRNDTGLPQNYDLKILAHITDKPILHSLLPGLTSLDSVHVDGSLTSRTLSFNIAAPNVVYGSNVLENGLVQVRGADSAFTYKVTADKFSTGKFSLWFADIHGKLDQNTITTNVSLADSTKTEQFALAATMKKSGDTQVVQLQNGLKLNYNVWDVAPANSIVLVKGGFYVRGFDISYKGQYIKANSESPAVNTPLKIDFDSFLLSNITEVMSRSDSILVNGVLNGNVTIQRMSPSVQVTSDLTIHNLSVLSDTMGDLHAQVSNAAGNSLDAKVNLSGRGNDVTLAGTYYTQPTGNNDFDFNLDIKALALRSMETIAQNQIKNSGGYIRGNLKVQGKISSPELTGEIRTDSVVTTVSMINAVFRLPAEKIEFSNKSVLFDNFTIRDSANNKAIFNGSVDITDMSNAILNLQVGVNAANFHIARSTEKDNKNYYGSLLVTTDLQVKGPVSAPSVNGDIKILKGTDFTVVTPESNPQLEASKGIVAFVNMKDTGRRNILKPRVKDSVKHKLTVGSEFNVNITVDKNAQFTLVIDQASGDFLKVKGEAAINATVNAGGVLTLAGTYDLHSGAYQLNYDFIKRKFLIQDGSTITFGGDPVKGTKLDINAIYEANVPPYDLVEKQVPDQGQLNYYKQNLPFDVKLFLKGEILQPAISFDIDLPENKVYPLTADQIELVQGKLNQVRTDTSELNKQVFALLILSRFVSDDPFSSAASNSIGFTALQSVSTFIGEQLNRAASKLVKGVDISADLQTSEDYTTGDMRQRTDFNLAASKTLLNDRLKLTIGNDFELEGPQTSNNQSSLVPSNLAADYLLSADGRYTMRGYRKAYNEGVLEGYVTETGLDFIVSLDYNNFRNAFQKKKKKNEDTTARK